MGIGENIRHQRHAMRLTLEEVADQVGISRQTMSRYETGIIANIPSDKIELLAKALKTTPSALMGWESPAPLPAGAIPIDFSKYHQIPILGHISAGLPLYADEHIEGYTLTDLNGGAEYFALRVHGDSMNASRINEGDIIIVRRQEEVEQGEVAVVLVDGENATVKRFYATDSTVTLMPQSTNPAHTPQIYDLHKTNIRVLGKVVKVEFKL